MTRKLYMVRAIVRPDRRGEYLERWSEYRKLATALGAQVWLFEDEALTGRFMEFTEYTAGAGVEAQLRGAAAQAGLVTACARRSGEAERYRECKVEESLGGSGGGD